MAFLSAAGSAARLFLPRVDTGTAEWRDIFTFGCFNRALVRQERS